MARLSSLAGHGDEPHRPGRRRHCRGPCAKSRAQDSRPQLPLRFGEIDIIAEDNGTLVFIEVRMRTRTDFGTAAESIHAAKRRRLVTAARHYFARTRADRACRFDAFLVAGSGGPVEWLKNVISE